MAPVFTRAKTAGILYLRYVACQLEFPHQKWTYRVLSMNKPVDSISGSFHTLVRREKA